MRSLLQQLENNEAVLLMYVAGELPPDDRVEVEQLLANDGGLRAELARLRESHDALTLALGEADGLAMPAVSEGARRSAAVRRVSRAISQHHAERQAAAAREAAASASDRRFRRLRLPGWSYPFAAAAMLLIAWVAYWGISSGSSSRGKQVVEKFPTPGETIDEPTAMALLTSLDSDAIDREALASSGAEDPGIDDLATVLRTIGQQELGASDGER